jgi:hypothetical protein
MIEFFGHIEAEHLLSGGKATAFAKKEATSYESVA